jgi:hypothetical protein
MAGEHEAEVGAQFMKPEPPKRGRGRPKKEDGIPHENVKVSQPQIDPIQESMQLTRPLVELYSGALVQIAEDERARLTGETKESMVHVSAVVINQYFGGIGAHAALITLAVITASTSLNAWKLRMENLEKLKAEKIRRDQANGKIPDGVRPVPNQPVN